MSDKIKNAVDFFDKREEESEKLRKKKEQKDAKFKAVTDFYDKKLIEDTNVDETYINTFLSDSKSYFSDATNDYKTIGYDNASSLYDTYSSRGSDLRKKANIINAYFNVNKSRLDEGDYNEMMSTLKGINTDIDNISKQFGENASYFKQWETEEDYNKSMADAEEIERLLGIDTEALQSEIEQYEKIWSSRQQSGLTSDEQTQFGGVLNDKLSNTPNNGSVSMSLADLENNIKSGRVAKLPDGSYIDTVTHNKVIVGNNTSKESSTPVSKEVTELAEVYNLTPDELADIINQKNQDLNKARRLQRWKELESVYDNDNFYVYNGVNTDFANDKTYKYINDIDGFRASELENWTKTNTNSEGLVFGSSIPSYLDSNYDQLNSKEIGIYNYLYATEGKEVAYEYLNSVAETINARRANELREENDTFLEQLFFSAVAGLDQWQSGVERLFDTSKDYYAPSEHQIASEMIKEDLVENHGKGWGTVYDVFNTTSNMLPTIFTSTALGFIHPALGTAVGLATMGGSTYGNSYAEMVNLGYSKQQAHGYAALTSASEVGLQYLLGGFSNLGGKLTGNAVSKFSTKLVSNIDKAFARIAIGSGTKIVGRMVSEFGEEYLQEILNPVFKNMSLGTHEDFKLYTPEALYAGFLGALSAGMLEGGNTIYGEAKYTRNATKLGKSIIDKGLKDDVVNLGKSLSADSIAYKIANRVNENTGAYALGNLLHEAGANGLSATNMADIQKSLVRKGVSEKDAQIISEGLNSVVIGKELTDAQISALEDNDVVSQTFRDVILNPKSTVNQRTQQYLSILDNLEKAEANKSNTSAKEATKTVESLSKEYEAQGMSPEQAKMMAVAQLSESNPNTSSPSAENLTESKFEVSDDGKTINLKTDKEVAIQKIDSISESGEANLTLDDGMIVKASDVAFGSPVERAFIEGIGAIKIGKKPIGVDSANALYQMAMTAWKSNPDMTASEADSLIRGLAESYAYGTYNLGSSKLSSRNEDGSAVFFAGELSQEQRSFAYNLGLGDSVAKAKAEQKVVDDLKAKANEGASSNTTAKKGRVRFEDGVVAKGGLQKRTVSLAKQLARAIGIDIVFYDARTTSNEDDKGANGYFDEDTSTIYLDLQNSWDDAKTIAFTLSHELVHFIKKWSPEKFDTFARFLMKQYGNHGVDTSELLSKKMVELKTNDEDLAYEEMICDACETMLLDSDAIYKLMELRKTDLELFDKIKLHIHELLNKIRNMYKSLGLEPSSDEAKALLEMKDVLEQIYSLFEEVAVDATQSYQAVKNANETIFGEESVDVGKTESGIKNQIKNHKKIGEDATAYNDRHKNVHKAILKVGIEAMYEMAETMLPYLEQDGILPPDIPGKTIFKNGSYGRTGENTTLCVRTLTYEDFKDRVAEEVGRPLTVSESLLVSQKIYDIATEPQCIYCYVAADRKAYDEYLGEYWKAMDKYIKAMRKGGDSKALYEEYLAGRKDTDAQKKRWASWEAIAKSGKEYISAKDLTTKRKRDAIIVKKNAFSEQIKDAQRYAQSASWAKTVSEYRAYKGDILKMTSKFVDMLNSEYGLRMYSFSDYTPAFIVENMQMLIDASVKGLKSLAYTKDTDYAEIFASTGQAINVSCFARWDAELGTYVEDNRQGANWEKTKSLRQQYRNVGAVMVATNDAMVEWALKQDWVDVVIPYHIVKTGTTIANEYQWNNYTSESADRIGNKTANIYPTEHNNDFATYRKLLEERGITPRFSRWYDMVESGKLTEEQYMKLVNEVRLPASELSAVVPSFNLEAAKRSFGINNKGEIIQGGFVDKGGYMGGWYREGVDVNQEVMAVSEDIKAGKSSLEVDYGMSKAAKEKVEEKYTHSIKRQAKPTNKNAYDYSKSFAEQIDDYKKGIFPQNDTLLVSGTPDVWKKVGFNALPVTINQTHVNYALNGTKDIDHHIGEVLLKDLPNAIQKPLAIIQSQSKGHENRAVVILKMVHNGQQVISAIEVDGQGTTNNISIDSNAMTTLFAKGNGLTQLKNAINNTVNGSVELFYWNKKEAMSLLQKAGVQFSSPLPQDGFVHSITEQSSKVKPKYSSITETQQFKRWFGDWQNNPKKASKIVNDDGTPMVVYHGTNEDFFIFDSNRTSKTTKRYAEGFYFTTEKKVAEKWGKFRAKEKGGNPIVMECFLDVKHPLIMTAREYQRLGFDDKYRDSVLQKLIANKNDGIIIYPEEERIPGVFADSYNYEAGDSVYHNADKYGITNKDYAWWLNRAVENPDFTAMQIAVFKPEQIKSATNNIGTFDSNNPDIRYQKKTTSNRTILANALEGTAQNDIEKNKLAEYKKKIELIEAEEQKLSEIQKQLFTKGGVEPSQRKELQFKAKQIANRINTYDRQLLNLESTTALKNVLNREKSLAMKRQKQMDAEALKQYKEKVAETQKELIERHQESRRKATESRNKTAMRHQIQRVVSELNTLLTHGNKKKHVPEDLKVAVAEVLELFNMDTVDAEGRIAKLKGDLMKAKTPEQIQEISRKIDNIEAMGDKVKARLDKLKSAYDTIKSSADPDIAGGFDELVSRRIEYVASIVGKTPLRNMSLEQLEAVYDVYTMVLNNIRDANSLFKKDKKETIENYASRVIGEVKQVGGEHEFTSPRTEGIRQFLWNNLKPIFAFEKIGSKTLTDLYEDVRSGEDTWAVDITEAKSFADSKYEKYNYKKWDFDKKYTFESTTGETFSLTLGQILSLYAYSKRPQAGDHLRIGGFVFDDSITTYKEKKDGKKSVLKYKVNIAKAHQISVNTLADVIGSLTNEQKAFVDEMQTYLSDVMGAKGNEVSMDLYNIRLFKEKNYFPLKSAKQFMFEQNEVAGEVKIKNSGFTESTVEHANNPIILNNFIDVWANHVNDMAMYHAFVVPLENFNRVFNYQTRRTVGMPAVSVKETLQNAYGTHAVSYIRQLLTDLNGGARSDPRESTAKKLTSAFKKAKVFASASVVIQQPSAVARALALIDEKYFDFNPKLIKHKERWEELKKYAPVAIIKEMGRFDTDMGMSTVDYIKGEKTLKQKVDDVLSKAPAYADELVWVHIWEAVKRETQAKHKDLKVGSEEFLKEAGKRFTEVITITQVYDSVLSRSANMRSKTLGMNMLTAFMAEPTTSINMVEQGLSLWNRGYKRTALKQFKGIAASVVLNAALVSLIYAMRDDDEDETFLEKYLGSFVSETIDGVNPLTYYPIVKDVWSLLQGYDVERPDMSLFSDIIDAVSGMVKTAATYDEEMSKEALEKFKDQILDNSMKLVDGVAAIFGISSGNIRREIDSIINTYKTLNNDFKTSGLSLGNALTDSIKDITPVWGWLPDEPKTDRLYEAIVKGDTAYVDRLKSGYKDEDAYQTALRKALRENDPRIREAAEASYNGDATEYSRIIEEIIAEGYFEVDDIRSAIKTEENKLKPDDDGEGKGKVVGAYDIDHYFDAIVSGDTTTANKAKDDIIKTSIANGKTQDDAEDSFNNSLNNEIRDGYVDGTLSRTKAMDMLVRYGGMENNDAYWQMKKYDYYSANGSYDGYSKYDDFYESVKTGKNLKAIINEYTSHGVSADTLAKQITTYYKPLYKQMTNSERAGIKGYLLNAYALLGKNRYEKSRDIDNWLKE